jgi:dihydroxyacetone kinase-like predicted kinase
MCSVFRDLGADNIIVGGQTMNPSTEDILTQIEATNAKTVFVLPNNKNIVMAAQQCIPLTNKRVVVIPSKTMPQGISALIALDTGATVEENTTLMTDAIARVHTAQLTYAARDSVFDGKTIKAGDFIALLEDTLVGLRQGHRRAD